MNGNNDDISIQTTQLSMDILESVRENNGARLSDIADAMDIAKSTAHKHLVTLRENGYLIKRGETYRVGLKLLDLGEHARRQWPAFNSIQSTVTELNEQTDEGVDFVAEDNGRITTICESYHKWVKFNDRRNSGSYRANIGTYYHMHSTASGLALLAEYPQEEVYAIVDRWGLPPRTENTITSYETLQSELESIREQGYVVGDEYYMEGLQSIGMAVNGPGDRPLGAISISGPTYRIDGAVIEEIIKVLHDAVEDLEATLETAQFV